MAEMLSAGRYFATKQAFAADVIGVIEAGQEEDEEEEAEAEMTSSEEDGEYEPELPQPVISVRFFHFSFFIF